jgi:hypothetical protein
VPRHSLKHFGGAGHVPQWPSLRPRFVPRNAPNRTTHRASAPSHCVPACLCDIPSDRRVSARHARW